MATMRHIRSRIKVAKNIEQITKAMKMVAAARLKRAQERVQSARPYAEAMDEIMGRLAKAAADEAEHPLLEKREVVNTGILLFTSDRGLAGSYNYQIMRETMELANKFDKAHLKMYIIGKKGNVFFSRRGYPVVESITVNSNAASLSDAQNIMNIISKAYTEHEIDELHIAYTRFVTAMTQHPTIEKLLPIEPLSDSEILKEEMDFLFEPEAPALIGELLPRFMLTQVYQALLESLASEHGSRMTSMSSATDNASKMISELTLTLNRARQAAITKEISEIVGGAEALKG